MESTTVEPKPLPIENTPVLPPSDAPTVDDIE